MPKLDKIRHLFLTAANFFHVLSQRIPARRQQQDAKTGAFRACTVEMWANRDKSSRRQQTKPIPGITYVNDGNQSA
jgi:hypothetical protein